jgi:hypothetical protein
VNVEVPIPPFDSLRWSYTKNCGGGTAPCVSVFLSLFCSLLLYLFFLYFFLLMFRLRGAGSRMGLRIAMVDEQAAEKVLFSNGLVRLLTTSAPVVPAGSWTEDGRMVGWLVGRFRRDSNAWRIRARSPAPIRTDSLPRATPSKPLSCSVRSPSFRFRLVSCWLVG